VLNPAGALGMPAFAKGYEAYHFGMSRINPERQTQDPSDRSVPADVVLRQEPDEEEDEEEDEDDRKKENDDDDDDEDENDIGDDGYSE